MRLLLRYRIRRMMAAAGSDAVMLCHKVASQSTVAVVHGAGGLVFAWTVDTAARIRQLQLLGVDGIASNYPELFRSLACDRRPGDG